jgi:hypothetical protein
MYKTIHNILWDVFRPRFSTVDILIVAMVADQLIAQGRYIAAAVIGGVGLLASWLIRDIFLVEKS